MANENENRETVADILAEMRKESARADLEQYYTLDDAAESMREFAGRIEAAWKRECEASRAYWTKKCRDTITEHDRYCSPVGNADPKFDLCRDVESVLRIGREFQKQDVFRGAQHDTAKLLCDTIEYLSERLSAQVGNAAAMREALEEIRVEAMSDYEPDADYLIEKCNAALSAPPRNCDVGTAEEQAERQKAYCRKHFTPDQLGGNCRQCPLKDRRGWSCQLAWAQMPYEQDAEKEGGAK